MPIVFVHGVNTRRGRKYDREVAARTALIRRILAPALGLHPGDAVVLNPYWGDSAARFRWGHASLPGDGVEQFGDQEPTDVLLAEALMTLDGVPEPDTRTLLAAAGRSMDDAVDLLWSAAASVEWAAGDDFEELATWAASASEWSAQAGAGELAGITDDLGLFAALRRRAEPDGLEQFGDQGAGLLREGLSRIQLAGGRLTTRGALAVFRRGLHENAATFLGDVLSYLRQRERHGPDSPITRTVADALAEAARARTDADPHVVVIAHSMGGNIVFDLLSHLRTDLTCDVLVTVGSQVGLFAELGLFPGVIEPVDDITAQRHRSPRAGAMAGARWVNVYDRCDVLSFATDRIFPDTEDYEYSTGAGGFAAHSSYFVRPSFFRKLARHIGRAA